MIDSECFERIGFFLSARGLAKMDLTSNTDPFAVVYVTDKKTNQQVKLGSTGCLMDTLDPDWPQQFVINYYFESVQEVTIKIYDKDGGYPVDQVSHHQACGEATFVVSSLMCAKGQKLTLNLTRGPARGTVSIQAEPISNTRDIFVGKFVGTKLANKDGLFGKSDPFLKFMRLYESGEWGVAFQSPTIMNNLNPQWPRLAIPMVTLCNGDYDRPIKIEIWDFDDNGKHDFMGCVETSVRSIMNSGGTPIDVIEPAVKAKKGKSYVNSGTLSIQNVFIENHPTLTDFIMGGCEISLIVALDFTASNGPCNDAASLHFISPAGNSYNQYQHAIRSVGTVLENYDSDKMYPVYGFGAKVMLPNGTMSPVQHCFPVYGGGLEVQGVDGILQAYKEVLAHVALSGPTLFAPLIQAATGVAVAANCSQERQKYTVLLIITDGEVNDMPATIDTIVAAADTPMSIIIVGVGSADFSSMNKLDGDAGALKNSRGAASTRDIVQFVPMRDFIRDPQALAQAVLAEVPSQLLKYMTLKGIRPNPAAGR